MSSGTRISRNGKRFAFTLAVAFILFIWQVSAWFLPDFLMPDVAAVIVRLWQELQSGSFRTALGAVSPSSSPATVLPCCSASISA